MSDMTLFIWATSIIVAFIAGGFLEWDSAQSRIKYLQNDNADLERALILSYQENETMREILLARTPRQEK